MIVPRAIAAAGLLVGALVVLAADDIVRAARNRCPLHGGPA